MEPTSEGDKMLKKVTKNSLVSLLLCGFMGAAAAQAYPNKIITIIVPFPPGGTTDVLARAVAQKLGPVLGQSVIVDNKPGAGATLTAKSTPDGYTLFMGAVHHTIAPAVYKTLPYSFEKDFAPIATVALVPKIMVVSEASPYKTVKDVVAAAKAKPDSLSYGSNGNGTAHDWHAVPGVDRYRDSSCSLQRLSALGNRFIGWPSHHVI